MNTKRKESEELQEQEATTQTYEHWRVVAQYKGNTITGWRKIEECIATIQLEPRYADVLNEQSHNSGMRYFLTK